jgi:hypothetical protein
MTLTFRPQTFSYLTDQLAMISYQMKCQLQSPRSYVHLWNPVRVLSSRKSQLEACVVLQSSGLQLGVCMCLIVLYAQYC